MYASVSRTSLINYLKERDYIKVGNVANNWVSVVNECEQKVKDNPRYWCSLVVDKTEFDSWDNIGNQYYNSIKSLHQWGYTSTNTRSWETTASRPQIEMYWEDAVKDWLPLDYAISRPTLQTPGNIMPWHQDNFFFFKRQYPEQSEFIVRFIVFMNDWGQGHMLQAGNSIITHWQAGDVILWYPNTWHLSANCGIVNKWTQNVTGVLKETVSFPGIDLSYIG